VGRGGIQAEERKEICHVLITIILVKKLFYPGFSKTNSENNLKQLKHASVHKYSSPLLPKTGHPTFKRILVMPIDR
jgi:hypothetical protein